MTHSGVDQSGYTFDKWYTEDGNEFKSTTVINSNLTVYPSWDTTLFWYVKSGSQYNIGKLASVTYDPLENLYIPGWRYKGLMIDSVSASNVSSPLPFRYIAVKDLYMGDGIYLIAYQSFANITADSLYLGEGLTEIKSYAFNNSSIGGSLKIPSTLKTIKDHAFASVGFDGTLDLSESYALKTIEWAAFMKNDFVGSLDFQEEIEVIAQEAFKSSGFTGNIDLSKTENLTTIGPNASYPIIFNATP